MTKSVIPVATEGYKFRLGVFVVSGFALAVAGGVAISAGRFLRSSVPVHMYFEESVQGLEVGSQINYRGVPVGRVTEISLRPPSGSAAMSRERKTLIEVVGEIFPDALTGPNDETPTPEAVEDFLAREVGEGLRITPTWKDITGAKYLALDYRDPALYPVRKDLGFAPEEPYLPTASSPSLEDIQRDLAQTISSLSKIDYQEIGTKVETLLDSLNDALAGFSGNETLARIEETATAVRDLVTSPELRDSVRRLDDVTKHLEGAARRADELLSKPELGRGIDDLAAAASSVRETARSLEETLPRALDTFEGAVDDARAQIAEARIPETTAAFRQGALDVGGVSRSVGAMREDLRVALREISGAGRDISRLARMLERRPEALLRGRAEDAGRE